MLQDIIPLIYSSIVYGLLTKKNNDLGTMRRYAQNILQWNKNRKKAREWANGHYSELQHIKNRKMLHIKMLQKQFCQVWLSENLYYTTIARQTLFKVDKKITTFYNLC